MKLRKAIKSTLTGTILVAPMSLMAAPPAAFDNYSVNGSTGAITSSVAGCASTGVDEAGFAQEQCSIGGKTYIHTILYDDTGAEKFTDESFIEMGGTGGISDKQTLMETSGTETFKNTAQINTGSFMPMGQMGIMSGNVMINLQQDITDTGAQAFSSGFDFKHGMNMVGMDGYNGKFADLTLTSSAGDPTYTSGFKFNNFSVEGVTMGDTAKAAADQGTRIDISGILNDSAASITQNFTLGERHGSFTTMDGTATGTVTWAAGDSIINTQIGQTVGGAGVFGLHDFANETNGLGTGVDSQTSALPGTFFQPLYTDGSNPFATF